MSSRNKHLASDERKRALAISRALFAAEAVFRAGERDVKQLIDTAKRQLAELDQLQYLELVDSSTLEPATSPLSRPIVLCVAAYVGSTRLIDNVVFDVSADEKCRTLATARRTTLQCAISTEIPPECRIKALVPSLLHKLRRSEIRQARAESG